LASCDTLADARRRMFLTCTAATAVGGAVMTTVPERVNDFGTAGGWNLGLDSRVGCAALK